MASIVAWTPNVRDAWAASSRATARTSFVRVEGRTRQSKYATSSAGIVFTFGTLGSFFVGSNVDTDGRNIGSDFGKRLGRDASSRGRRYAPARGALTARSGRLAWACFPRTVTRSQR